MRKDSRYGDVRILEVGGRVMVRSKCALWKSQGGTCGALRTCTLRRSSGTACLVNKLKFWKVGESTSCHESEIKGKVGWCGNVSRCALYGKAAGV